MTLGEKLQQLRRAKGLSQDRLAELLQVSRQAVSKWERDETVPETDKVIRLSEIFAVSTDYLLKEQPQPQKEKPPQAPDFFSRLGQLIQTRGYYLGYALVLWGVLDFVQVFIAHLAWRAISGAWGDFSDSSSLVLQSMINVPLTAIWINVIVAAGKLALGIFVVLYGRRKRKNLEDGA